MNKKIALSVFTFLFVTSTMQAQVSEELSNQNTSIEFTPPRIKPDIRKSIFATADEMPQYVGGEEVMNNFISENLRYPIIAAENNIQGQVIVRFVVSRNGRIKDVEVEESLNPLCDKEAVRVIKSMPKWIPGQEARQKVNVRLRLPIVFKLPVTLHTEDK